MIDQHGRGVLNDWDHAVKVPRSGNKHTYRTVGDFSSRSIHLSLTLRQGTWQFISIALLRRPTKEHDLLDDIESCFWVLLYVSFIHFELIEGKPNLNIFSEYCNREVANGTYHALGGQGKQALVSTDEMFSYKWKSLRLTWLLTTFATILGRISNLKFEAAMDQAAEATLKGAEEAMRTVHPILNHFNTALAADDWVDDHRVTLTPKITNKQDTKDQLLAKTGTLGNANGPTLNFPTSKERLFARISACSGRSSIKRGAEAIAAEDVSLIEQVKHVVKRARIERCPPNEAEQPLPHEHRYRTRSKTKPNSSTGNTESEENVSHDVDVNHAYRPRSKTKAEKSFPHPRAPSVTAKKPTNPVPKQFKKRTRLRKKNSN